MEKTHDFEIKAKAQDRASANENERSANSADHISVQPPILQLKADSTPEKEESKKQNTLAESTYQLATEGTTPPPANPDAGYGEESKQNNTGLPTQLKTGVENLSGFSLDDVKVHYNSDKPAQLQAHAFAQGADIHLASGQEKHLPHETWHVVQQKQGRVQPTTQLKAFNINDDAGLEKEADMMGAKAISQQDLEPKLLKSKTIHAQPIQRKKNIAVDLDQRLENKLKLHSLGLKGKIGQERRDLIWATVKSHYKQSYEKGSKLWATYEMQKMKLNSPDHKDSVVNTLKNKRSKYDQNYEDFYRFKKLNMLSEDKVAVMTNVAKEKGGEGDTSSGKDAYNNNIDTKHGVIEAAHNYGDRDNARISDTENKDVEGYEKRGLPNSEVLWKQYHEVAQLGFSHNKTKRADKAMKKLNVLRRANIQNPETIQTAWMALPDGIDDVTTPHVFPFGSEEFFALLGTPNCRSAVFMLMDHMDQLDGKSIASISTSGDNQLNLDINFT